ncbi:MAG: hypothetical protein AAF662_15775, partial [Pseudomonadota bacterium]
YQTHDARQCGVPLSGDHSCDDIDPKDSSLVTQWRAAGPGGVPLTDVRHDDATHHADHSTYRDCRPANSGHHPALASALF